MDPNDIIQKSAEGQLRREEALTAAIADGRLIEASVEGWRARWDREPKATEKALAGLAPGVAPTTASEPPIDADEAYRQLTGQGGEGGIG